MDFVPPAMPESTGLSENLKALETVLNDHLIGKRLIAVYWDGNVLSLLFENQHSINITGGIALTVAKFEPEFN